MSNTFSIHGVEIFSCGTWNGDEYTMEDLNEMVTAFNETQKGVRPYIKLGHDDKQELLQQDGLPAAGWIDRLYIKGDKLVADISDIPKKIYDLIQTKAYRKVSSEIYWNLKVGEKLYKRFLGAVALLGTDMPGRMNLSDILGQYKALTTETPKIYTENIFDIKQKEVNIKNKEEKIMEEKVQELEAELKKFKADAEAKTQEIEKANKELADLKKFKAEAEVATAKALQEAKEAQDQAFISELEKENLCTPAMKPFVAALIGEEKKEYSIKNDKNEEQKLNKSQLLKETLKLFKAIDEVNLDERSKSGDTKSKNDDKAREEKIAKYMQEHKATYSQAVKAILKDETNKQ